MPTNDIDDIDNKFVFIIIMRNDLDSLNPGKACAQAAHAGNMLTEAARDDGGDEFYQNYCKWIGDRGFGITKVGAGSLVTINSFLESAQKLRYPTVYGVIEDPTYPIRDGLVTHYIPLLTCAWIFGNKDVLDSHLPFVPLMP